MATLASEPSIRTICNIAVLVIPTRENGRGSRACHGVCLRIDIVDLSCFVYKPSSI